MDAFAPRRTFVPLDLPGIIDQTLDALRRNWMVLVQINLVMIIGAGALFTLASTPVVFLAIVDQETAALALALVLLVALPALVVWFSVGSAALVAAVGGTVLGHKPGVGEAFLVGRGRWLPLLGTGILLFVLSLGVVAPALLAFGALLWGFAADNAVAPLVTGALSLVCLVPLVVLASAYVGTRLAFAQLAVVLEGRGPLAAIERSWDLTRGYVLRVFAYMFVVGLTGFVLGTVDQLPVNFAERMAESVTRGDPGGLAEIGVTMLVLLAVIGVSFVLTLAISLATQIALVVLYYDLRVRKESFGHPTEPPAAAEWPPVGPAEWPPAPPSE